ncbi:sodium-coupled monocarboxylate transporter 1-like isoform X2 [Pseudomyrmex gracilis]|uniref:sodium-coupled monocarboxylate transporter 1-like isoform X2 n=1 Tax=Pseudomyrmex gracilis TaxID=219809 RepID=UPI000994ECC3|nr:sodium-coupled monocarboxylate transporter 1-like isoform X2 [Pseudomyrmex gracilis]
MIVNDTESFFVGHEFKQLTFGWTDYILFGGLLGISVLIGVYFGFFSTKQNTTTEYLLGGKTMSFFPISMSLIARFNRPVRQLASFLFSLALVVYVPLIIYVPALAFSQATGLNLHFVAPVICVVCIFYTTIGGLKAVVWADTVQMMVTVGSLVAVLILGTIAVGGVGETWRIAGEGGRLIFWNMDPSPFARNSFWGMSIGMVMTWLASLGINQVSMQRFLAVPTIKEAQKSMWVLSIGLVVVKFISVFTGLTMYARYHKCDPISAHVIARIDKILPYYVLDVAADVPGLPGLFLAGLVSAGLSTMSAGLNTVAGTIYEDFIDRWVPESNDKETKAANIIKVTVVILGILAVGMVFLVAHLSDIFQLSLTITGITAGAMLGLFSLGMLVPWATTKGAIVGGLVSMVTMIWIIVGAQWNMVNGRLYYEPLPLTTEGCLNVHGLVNQTTTTTTTQNPMQVESLGKPFFLYRISFMYYTLLGATIVIIIGTVVSFVCGAPDISDVDRDHFPPFIARFLPPKKYIEVSLHTVPTALVTNLEKEELKSV